MSVHASSASHVNVPPIAAPASDQLSGVVWRLTRTRADAAPLIARLVLGAVMFPHGAQKALGWFGGSGWVGTMDMFTGSMGIPAAFATLAIAAEFLGSIGLLVGALSRLAALGIASVMVGAILLVHGRFGFFMNWSGSQSGEGLEYHLLALGLALVVLIKGGGAFSFDHWLSRLAAPHRTGEGTS